ncbi:RES family NAD+ phosphorylase [Spirosoma sordidisoli]|uniref:RES domain-containing protein n=1 Tax=Spirosoma sordidisoli TaxID=2502893 RepID=A0A4Q2UML8_9BACT|nr:RES family NAD+ phosphorylase [Spirosoma sordidisoli]RYC70022.1 RES domain-containing protein [Spirosoma sordidisoli]
MRVYRLIKERFVDTPLSTEGARRLGGRWNPVGVGILYSSASPELTLLEQLLHLPTLPYEDLPTLCLLTLELPKGEEGIELVRTLTVDQLPVNWRDEADFRANHACLANWLVTPDVLAVGVPSAVVAESVNYLLHPRHSAYERITVISAKPFPIDPCLWRTAPAGQIKPG